MKLNTLNHLNIEQTHPIIQLAVGAVIAVVMTAVFLGFLGGMQP
jgi:hypothetical protein